MLTATTNPGGNANFCYELDQGVQLVLSHYSILNAESEAEKITRLVSCSQRGKAS